MGFKKFQILAQNPNGLASNFTEKHQHAVKTDQNNVFLRCKNQILDRLHIMVMYINFYGFFKKSIFSSKSKMTILRHYRKR
jgi:hypothetical protein